MKLLIIALLCCSAVAQTAFVPVVATSLMNASGDLVPKGRLCFTATDQNDNPVNFQAGGLGQVINRPACTAVVNGAIGSFQVANPDRTLPFGVLYRVELTDPKGTVISYPSVAITGVSTFNLDMYVPTPVIPIIQGGKVLGPLEVGGDLTVDGACLGCTKPSVISFNLEQPNVGDTGLWQHKFATKVKLQRISCSTDSGTASLNFDVRQESTPNTLGASVLSTAITCTPTTGVAQTFAISTLNANQPLALDPTTVSGSPNIVRVHVQYLPQ